MDLETEHLVARLNAQSEYMDMNEEDCDIDAEIDGNEEEETELHGTYQSETQSTTQATQATQNAPRKRKLTSKVRKDIVSVGIEDDGEERGKCIHCRTKLVINTKTHGTKSLLRHLEKCPKKPKNEDRPPYDHQINREMTSEIIIYHDLPFRYPEYEKVRARDKYLNPECQPICRQTTAADVYRKYEMEKVKLKEVLANHRGRVCFTSDLWKSFSDITTHFSGSKYPTSNVYFTQEWRIELFLRKFASCDDEDVAKLAQDMQIMFTKYWEDYSLILAMGVVLDPRMKLQMLEVAYERVDPTLSASKIKKLKDNLEMLYEDYKAKSRTCSSSVSVTPNPHDWINESPLDDDYDNDLFELEKSIGVGVGKTKTHLDIYLEELRLERKSFPKLDVLSFGKDNQHRLGELAYMACEILSIPITTVASESAFSIGSRVITPYRNRLLPKNVQALLCTRNWLHGFADYEGNIETNDDIGTTECSRSECSRSDGF